jgi:hypothetical protein
MRTVVIQTFRERNVPQWLERAMQSVRSWAMHWGYEYQFRGDEIFDLCGDAYLRAVGDNKRSITNLARLEWINRCIAEGYERVIWLDADTFIFDPEHLDLEIESGYAAGREVWIEMEHGRPRVETCGAHNAALVVVGRQPDIDWMIATIRYIAGSRPLQNSFQVGVKLLTGLHAGLRFPVLPQVGILSPATITALATERHGLLRMFAQESGYPLRAANLCWSQTAGGDASEIERAMDLLEATRGMAINRFLDPAQPAPLTLADYRASARPMPALAWWWMDAYEQTSENLKIMGRSAAWWYAKLGDELTRRIPARLKVNQPEPATLQGLQ